MRLWGHCCREGKTFDQTFFFTSFAMLHSSIRHEFIQVHSCRYFVFSCIVSVQQMQVLRVENGSVDSVDSDITEDRDNIEDVTNIRTDVKTLFLRAAPYLQSWYRWNTSADSYQVPHWFLQMSCLTNQPSCDFFAFSLLWPRIDGVTYWVGGATEVENVKCVPIFNYFDIP